MLASTESDIGGTMQDTSVRNGNDDYHFGITDGSPPLRFPSCDRVECVRMTARVCYPNSTSTRIAHNILVRTLAIPSNGEDDYDEDTDDSDSDSDSSDDSDSEDGNMAVNDDDGAVGDRAYWLQRTLSECIYGRVRLAYVLTRRSKSDHNGNEPFAEWLVTGEKCAVKEMPWDTVRRLRPIHTEDPIAEVDAMSYMANYLITQDIHKRNNKELRNIMDDNHILLPMDAPLSDGRNLYSIMPYCNGGELFAVLDGATQCTEPQARYWIHQILKGIETLQQIGVCHRDISLENVIVHDNRCFLMDYGMVVRIPYSNIPSDAANGGPSTQQYTSATRGERQLIESSGTSGKWQYMSPEIAVGQEAFDGHAVDLFAVGSILFTMVTGFQGWERPVRSDEPFRYLSGGYLERMLTEWNLGLTPSCMDLLQKMIYFSPKDRLSLAQIWAHPWMQGETEIPSDRPAWS